MICLTCDIHHASLNTGNQQHSDISETKIAACFAIILKRKMLQATFFISGKCFEDEWKEIKTICDNPFIEIGGHNYNCFTPELWHRLCKKLLGSYNGPSWQQEYDIIKTKTLIFENTGINITSWRNHMYMHSKNTEKLLARNGIKVCCDGVKRNSRGFEQHSSGLVNYPINIIPDHEHLYHAERTPQWVEQWQKRYNWSDDYGSESYYFNDWFDLLVQGIEEREAQGITSHLLIHPITLYLCGGFAALEKVANYLSQFSSTQVTELCTLMQSADRGILAPAGSINRYGKRYSATPETLAINTQRC